ncbi:hypothetical protein JL721_12182 [Aureococcus anophagefferens]|nr:hypothetical protein JL721_12182 [Aureococcus anophagefferens]
MVLTIESGKASLAEAFPLRLELSFPAGQSFVIRHYVHALRRDGQTWIMWNAPGGAKGGIVPVIAAVADPALCAHGKIEGYHAQEQILGKLGVARKTRSEHMAVVFYGGKKRMKVNAVTEMLAIWTMNSFAATCAIEPLRTAVRQLHFDAELRRPLGSPTAAASPQTGAATAELAPQTTMDVDPGQLTDVSRVDGVRVLRRDGRLFLHEKDLFGAIKLRLKVPPRHGVAGLEKVRDLRRGFHGYLPATHTGDDFERAFRCPFDSSYITEKAAFNALATWSEPIYMATFVGFLKSGGANQQTDFASGDLGGLQADVARIFGDQMARFGNSGVGFHELSIEDQTTRAEMAVAALEIIAGVETGSLASTTHLRFKKRMLEMDPSLASCMPGPSVQPPAPVPTPRVIGERPPAVRPRPRRRLLSYHHGDQLPAPVRDVPMFTLLSWLLHPGRSALPSLISGVAVADGPSSYVRSVVLSNAAVKADGPKRLFMHRLAVYFGLSVLAQHDIAEYSGLLHSIYGGHGGYVERGYFFPRPTARAVSETCAYVPNYDNEEVPTVGQDGAGVHGGATGGDDDEPVAAADEREREEADVRIDELKENFESMWRSKRTETPLKDGGSVASILSLELALGDWLKDPSRVMFLVERALISEGVDLEDAAAGLVFRFRLCANVDAGEYTTGSYMLSKSRSVVALVVYVLEAERANHHYTMMIPLALSTSRDHKDDNATMTGVLREPIAELTALTGGSVLRFTVTHPANGRTYVLEFSFFGFVVDMMAEFALIGTADFKSAPNRDAPKHTGDKRFAQLADDDGNLGFIVVSNLEGNLAFVNSLAADGKEKGVTGISGHGVVDARLVSWCALHLAGRLFAAFITFVFTTINTWAKLSGPAFIAVAKAVRDAIKFDLQLKTKKYTSRLMVSNQGGNAARHAFQRWLPFSDVILAMIPHDERHGPRVRLVGRLLELYGRVGAAYVTDDVDDARQRAYDLAFVTMAAATTHDALARAPPTLRYLGGPAVAEFAASKPASPRPTSTPARRNTWCSCGGAWPTTTPCSSA